MLPWLVGAVAVAAGGAWLVVHAWRQRAAFLRDVAALRGDRAA
jgi:hypothetical protein